MTTGTRWLPEMGLRILASNREDAAGAIGEGALGTIEARDKRKRQTAADKMDAADRARRIEREDTQEARAVEKEKREVKKFEREMDTGDLEKYIQQDGTVVWGKKGEGFAYTPDGKKIKVDVDSLISATS